MESVQKLWEFSYRQNQRFRAVSTGEKYDTICITAGDESDAEIEEASRPESELLQLFEVENGYPTSTLCLIYIKSMDGLTMNISGGVFVELFHSMHADPCVLHMITMDYDGLHHYRSEDVFTGYIGMPEFALVWTSQYKKACTTTRALLFHRRRKPFPDFRMILRIFVDHIHSPYLLAFVSVLQMIYVFDRETASDLRTLRSIEVQTGYTPSESTQVRQLNVDDLSIWSQIVGALQVIFANKRRTLRVWDRLQGLLSDRRNEAKESFHIAEEGCTRALREITPVLDRHIAAYREYLEYLNDRTEKLSDVLFGLMTHEDAKTNLRLVEEAKQDSASMKTIAIMTMAFLPGTFLAALFAVPSLQWGQATVIQDNFWVYWACAIPATVFVFLIWIGIMYSGVFLGVLRRAARGQ